MSDLMEDAPTVAVDEDEPVWGAEEMGKVIKRTTRATWCLLLAGALPARKVGGKWVSTRRRLRTYLAGEDGPADTAKVVPRGKAAARGRAV
jgi:hypothetical protein